MDVIVDMFENLHAVSCIKRHWGVSLILLLVYNLSYRYISVLCIWFILIIKWIQNQF